MRERHFFLLVILGALNFGTFSTPLNVFHGGTCRTSLTQQDCIANNDSTSDFLMCVGIPLDPGAVEQQILSLKGLIDALLDVLVFMNSGLREVPLLNVSTGVKVNSTALLQDDDVIRMWLQIRLTPLLSTISQNFLTCLSYNNFSCQTYQTLVQELSNQFSSLDPQRQQWIYSYFMQPFLSRSAPAGCVHPGDTTEDWLTKNFGSFSVLAQLRDFSSINGLFNGMDVLHLLSPEQKAALMLYPDSAGLNNESLGVVLGSLLNSLTPQGDVNSSVGAMWNAGFPVMYSSSPQDPLTQTVNGLMTAFNPVGGFVREFVSFTHQHDLSSMRSATLIQAMLNWTLAELAAPFKNTSNDQQMDQTMFNPTDVNSWFTHVVVPILNRYLSSDIPDDLTAVFHNVFFMENSVNQTQDPCSITLNGACGVTNVMEHVAEILQCAASTNLTLTEETVTSLVLHLSSNLNTLLNQIAHTNFSSEDSPFRDILERIHDPSHVDLSDVTFVYTWFNIRLKPLLPTLTPDYLLCLSAKPFSCLTFQILVQEMSKNMFRIAENGTGLVYENFIIPFLSQHNSTGACMGNSSSEWIKMNLGGFSQFATVQEMYLLNPEFNALEALDLLTLNQTAEIIVEELPRLPDKEQLINIIFNNVLTSQPRRLQLPQLVLLISQMNMMKNNCMVYKDMFLWLHFASLSTSPEAEAVTLSSINNLMKATPAACVSYSGRCSIPPVNGTTECDGVNSSALLEYINKPHNGSQLCSFNIKQYACAQLTSLSTVDLATVLSCNLYGNNTTSKGTWKLFVLRVSPDLGPALDLLTNMSGQPSPSLPVVLDVISDVTFSTFSPPSFMNNSFIQLWFGERLRPFLPYASPNFLSCLSKNNFSCETYQSVVKIFSGLSDKMSLQTQMSVYVYFIYTFLSNSNGTGCAVGVQSSVWLIQNLGAFARFATVSELQSLNPTLSVMDILSSLSLAQLVQVSTAPELIRTPAQVTQVMDSIPQSELGPFFTKLSATLTGGGASLSPVVSEAFLQEVFTRVNLGDPMMPDSEVEQWINVRLQPFISDIQVSQIPVYFNMITQRSCNISHQGVGLLNSAHSDFNTTILNTINDQLLTALKGPLLNCYSNDLSYYTFLQSYIMGFQFPSLSTFLSLMPPGRMAQLVSSMSPAQMSEFLNHPGTVDHQTSLCELFKNYNQTETYLQSEPILSSALASQTLQCVWPQAISATSQADVDRWFNVVLVQYQPYLSSQMISFTQMSGASCLAFSKFVSSMGNYNFGKANFTKQDVYGTIQSYLTTANPPKCYNPADPTLNSTAWFYQYIGVFITFITVGDLQQFGGTKLQQFTSNKQNLELFTNYTVNQDVISVYSNMLFDASPDFSVSNLPKPLWCSAPANAFTALTQSDVMIITESLQKQCTNIDPTVSSALASNVATLNSNTIVALGNSITGLSVGQISSSNPSTLLSSLSLLSSVNGWSQSQAMAIIQSLFSSGEFKITSAESLQQLGSLLVGVPSMLFSNISAWSLLSALQFPSFLSNVLSTPIITQQIIVNQIISLNSSSDTIVQNVPGNLTQLIPRPSLLFLSQQSATTLNQKQWTNDQAMLFFDIVANDFSNADNISFQVLQGFTCTRVQRFSTQKVKNLIRGCRRRGNKKVNLEESQLTCMYNYIKSDSVTVFSDYPADMLLYYNLSQVQPSLCQSYYSALGEADFSMFSPTLAFRRDTLLMNAQQCLGVSGMSVNRTQLEVMGRMVCVFNSTYILNSDPYVLEKLKLCNTLTSAQSSAVQNVLISGNTIYGAPTSWNQSTLMALGDLPLYLSSNFWAYFTQKEKVSFLRTFIPALKSRGMSRKNIFNLITVAGNAPSSNTRSLLRFRRDTACTVGEVTQVQTADDSFPFGYDVAQFNACLSAQTLKDNLAAITDKATGSDYQKVILDKLSQAYPAGLSDQVLQVLGPASRAASSSDISKWTVTSIDTLSALMKSYNGDWSPEQVRAIVSRYLTGNRTLGTNELNALGGTNLCALNTILLNTISSSSLQLADPLQLSNCSLEQKQVLFNIAQLSFSDQRLSRSTQRSITVSTNAYQLIQNYLPGADLAYVRTLSISNISMDLLTFISLDQSVVNNLTVSEVQGLLGVNVPDLKTYENNMVVHNWIILQLQSDLNTLGINLTGGRSAPTATTASTPANANATANSNSTTNANATTTKPTAAGSSISASSGLQKLLLLGVTMATLQLIH